MAPSSEKPHEFDLTSSEAQTGIADFENGGVWIGKDNKPKHDIAEAQRGQMYHFRSGIFF